MPTLDEHPSNEFTKLIFIGDSGTGKTGAMASLLADGYSFKIIDMDNGLDFFKYQAKKMKADLTKVEFEIYRDSYTIKPAGLTVKGQPKAFTKALEKMTEWSEIDDPNCIFVLDSLSSFGRAAFEWAKYMNPVSNSGKQQDARQWYFTAQQAVESTLALLTSSEFRMNVIVVSHVNYKEVVEGTHKGYVNAIGTALGPTIPKYFNTLVLAESSGQGEKTRRRIKTMPTGVIDLKLPNPEVDNELPLENGLSTIFKALKGQ